MKQHLNHLFTAINILIMFSLLIVMSNADLTLSRLIIEPDNQWPGIHQIPWTTLYTFAPVPGFILVGCALVLFLAGIILHSLKKFRRKSLFLILLLILGPGLLVNVILKDHLGRPRPQELVEFGGTHQFIYFWQSGPAGKNSSFPSGHASIAFYLMAPWFICRKSNRSRALFFLWTGTVFGLLVGIGRIMQGGHFISDVLWAGGLVYITGELLSWVQGFGLCTSFPRYAEMQREEKLSGPA